MRYLLGILIGLLGGFVWSVGRSLKMVDPNHRRWNGRLSPSVITYIGWTLICYGALTIGGWNSAATPVCIVIFSLLSYVLQVLGFRFTTGMSYGNWAANNPEQAKSFQSKKKELSTAEPINLKEFRSGIQGRSYAELIRHHISRQTTQQLQDGSLDTINFLPQTARCLVENLIWAWDLRALDHEFWKTDCAKVFDAIVADARNRLIDAQAPTDDETLFNMFQVVTLKFAHSASYQPKMRESLGI